MTDYKHSTVAPNTLHHCVTVIDAVLQKLRYVGALKLDVQMWIVNSSELNHSQLNVLSTLNQKFLQGLKDL